VWEPAEILRQVNNQLVKYLGNADAQEKADGIEMTIFCVDTETKEGLFSGAKGYAYLAKMDEVKVFRGDKITLGHNANAAFSQQSFTFQSKDWLVQTTDGFVDQFGGAENKKYGRSRLQWLLQELAKGTTNPDFAKIFKSWKGNLPQVDDVLVLGYQL
jgi:hypothetical protein